METFESGTNDKHKTVEVKLFTVIYETKFVQENFLRINQVTDPCVLPSSSPVLNVGVKRRVVWV